MGFCNFKTKCVVPPCQFIEEVIKETTVNDKIVVSYSRVPYVPRPLPRYDTFSIENCQAAGINLESVSPFVLDGRVDSANIESAIDSIIGDSVSSDDAVDDVVD